jgi:hypothetical protein
MIRPAVKTGSAISVAFGGPHRCCREFVMRTSESGH